METVLTLIYVLLHIVPSSTSSFTLQATPDTTFHVARAERGEWVARVTSKTGEKPFGTLKVEDRILEVITPKKTMKFPAADQLGLPQAPDWAHIERIGTGEMQWTLQRLPQRIEFTLHLSGREHPQKVVTTLDSTNSAK